MKWSIFLLLACMACSKRPTLTTSLNGSSWSGTGEATEIHTNSNKTCSVDRFSILVSTTMPYNMAMVAANNPLHKPNSTVNPDSTVRQLLSFYHTPLEKSTYNLALPDTCLRPTTSTRTDHTTGASFHILNSTTRDVIGYYEFTTSDTGWVKIKKLNWNRGKVKGRFGVTLTDSKGQKIYFKNGKFTSNLVTQF